MGRYLLGGRGGEVSGGRRDGGGVRREKEGLGGRRRGRMDGSGGLRCQDYNTCTSASHRNHTSAIQHISQKAQEAQELTFP